MKTLVTQSELSPLRGEKDKKKKRTDLIKKFVLSFFLAILTVTASFWTQIGYTFSAYSSFAVNGASMYPTLNYEVQVYNDETGEEVEVNPATMGDYRSGYTYITDFGVADSSSFLNKIHRFSIVVTYFPEDFYEDGTLKPSAELKIKRIIGMPGDTLKIDLNGDLFVLEEGTWELIPQPFLDYNPAKPLATEEFLANSKKQTCMNGSEINVTLGEDEYFLLGDNRLKGASYDSRYFLNDPVTSSCFVGVATAIIGRGEVKPRVHTSFIWSSYLMPWGIRYL